MPYPTIPDRSLEEQDFRDVIGRFASGVTVITATHNGQHYGTTASAVSSLSLDPPMLLVCLNETSSTGQAVSAARGFAVNILGAGQEDLAMRFASKSDDKFGDIEVDHEHGVPLLGGALATLVCRVTEVVRGGTHLVYLAEVDRAASGSGAPLAYFRGQFGTLQVGNDLRAYTEVHERILDGRLRPGQTVDVQELADATTLKPGPLQFALGQLESEGLLRLGDDGVVVPPLSLESLRHSLEGRRAIELGVVDLVLPRLSPAKLNRLRQAQSAWIPVTSAPGWHRRHEQSMTFHETFVSLIGIPPLVDAYRQLGVPSLLAQAFRGYSLGEQDESYGDEHLELIAALTARDAGRARDVINAHTDHIWEQVSEFVTS